MKRKIDKIEKARLGRQDWEDKIGKTRLGRQDWEDKIEEHLHQSYQSSSIYINPINLHQSTSILSIFFNLHQSYQSSSIYINPFNLIQSEYQ